MIYSNLTEFINECSITRTKDRAEIVVDYYSDKDYPEDIGKPVRLIGFSTCSIYSDFEIFEQGYSYYKELVNKLGK